MDAKLKQRAIGAVILFSLAIIFIPFLLDGDEAERERLTQQIPLPPPVQPKAITPEAIQRRMDAREKASEVRLPREVADETDYTSKEGFQLDKNQLPVAWSLQVGSFRQQDNALELRARLRRREHRAYILQGRSEDQDIYRVYIGPDVSKEKLLDLGRQLQDTMALPNSILVRYNMAEDTGQLGG